MEENSAVMSVKSWVITLIIVAIPFVGVVALFVWAFSEDTNKNKVNFAKATLIFMAFSAIFFTVISFVGPALNWDQW